MTGRGMSSERTRVVWGAGTLGGVVKGKVSKVRCNGVPLTKESESPQNLTSCWLPLWLATDVPTYTITYHTGAECHLANVRVARPTSLDHVPGMDMIDGGASLLFLDAHEEEPGAVAYDTTVPCD
ncbi:hypothetical protein B0H14DRAFT_2590106 [Mycena olivaceomarginata]|nr:hypothetical protein B0H14DRAFT_2590106 [Mycena olivaceomarginata]